MRRTRHGEPTAPIKDTITCPKCKGEMELEPADPNYGADADGNRGRYVSACWTCECGHTEDYDVTDVNPDHEPDRGD